MPEIRTARLRLVALTRRQLEQYLRTAEALEREIGLPLSRAVLTARVRRAIELKLGKMAAAPEPDHPWYTYWLAVVEAAPFGAGLLGFKGRPDAEGVVEIGYGIDPGFGGQGYTTEAARALIGWAFGHDECRAVIAPNTARENVASNRVLARLGMRVYDESAAALSWRIDREDPESQA